MEEQPSFDSTTGTAYPFCITPFRARNDHEDMNVSVRSLVNIFEHERIADPEPDPESNMEVWSEGPLRVWLPSPSRDPNKLPDVVPSVDMVASSPASPNRDFQMASWGPRETSRLVFPQTYSSEEVTNVFPQRIPPKWVDDKSQLCRMPQKENSVPQVVRNQHKKIIGNKNFIQALIEAMDRNPTNRVHNGVTNGTKKIAPMKSCRIRIPNELSSLKTVQGLLDNNDNGSKEDIQARIERWTRVASSSDMDDFGDSDKEEEEEEEACPEDVGPLAGGGIMLDATGTKGSWDIHSNGLTETSSEPQLQNAKPLRECDIKEVPACLLCMDLPSLGGWHPACLCV